ncbi:MAG: hypothetical protein ACI3Z7_01470 [Candidatus Aphodosoma sp.]
MVSSISGATTALLSISEIKASASSSVKERPMRLSCCCAVPFGLSCAGCPTDGAVCCTLCASASGMICAEVRAYASSIGSANETVPPVSSAAVTEPSGFTDVIVIPPIRVPGASCMAV